MITTEGIALLRKDAETQSERYVYSGGTILDLLDALAALETSL